MSNNSPPTKDKQQARRRQRNWAVFIALLVFVLLVYAVTIVKIKMGGGQ
jgi:hypothetical protein